ncbi:MULTISPECIES: FecR family protein [Sphingobium]|jgi:transmembrane sensor|uniref:FecR family protein n=1 Tax=Sphingobium TaxID=165695 RepID=UPI000C45FD25|nr:MULTISPECIES: FecR domain-containing protein [Sphingobium]MBA37020.1 iron dicitrate transport regulator FecR [Sphingobium sp.]MEE2742097.1 FecR domain-containing protein [Pseudomonadota bacterium]MBS46245.1 iron dicitrate transport regulator FecR [Sphingobium sp.]MCC4255187.1 FecR domain-containing protein [Sphingobium lactosutens]HCW60338.1 iron dicitrate transport regulator FecR [Sphingobium sp.]|tara:strand:- start:2479 stop:3423 length:945 start_codon:yes stop_codon:yes gene_type:complete
MVNEEALAWVIRTRDPGFDDWEAFTIWLEGDPARALAYDALMAQDADLDAIIPADPVTMPLAANDAAPPRRVAWRWAAGGAVAAALVATVSIGTINRADIYSVTTRPGETRRIALDDGTMIDLNGDTRLRLDRNDMRFAALDRGEAAFTVRHDASDPFRVNVGDAVFEDAGTVFNIVHTAKATRIGVSEGKVIYNPEAEAIALPAGRALADDAQGLRVMNVAPAAVASWREGRLVYSNAAIDDISQDISRSLGIPVTATASAGAMRFTGTIRLDRNPARFFSGAAPLMGLSAVSRDGVWVLKPASSREGNAPQD